MLSSNGNHPYLRPEYLNPPPSNMDSKTSPLALLAQTCNQIGLPDTTAASSSSVSPSSENGQKSTTTTTVTKSTTTNANANKTSSEPTNKGSTPPIQHSSNKKSTPPNGSIICTGQEPEQRRSTPSASSASRAKSSSPKNNNRHQQHPSSSSSSSSIITTAASTAAATMTTSTTAAEVSAAAGGLQISHPSLMAMAMPDYKSLMMMNAAAFGASPFLAAHHQAAGGPFAPPPPPPHFQQHPAALAAAAAAAGFGLYPPSMVPNHPAMDLSAYANALSKLQSAAANMQPPPSLPPTSSSASAAATTAALLGNYFNQQQQQQHQHPAAAASYSAALALHYSRMSAKPPSSVEPPCRDPYCTGCTPPPPHPSLSLGASVPPMLPAHPMIHCPLACPSSLAGLQCDHLRLRSSEQTSPPSQHKPFVCNWIVADNYCGKRFASSEDLLQHLRIHTSMSSSSMATETTSASSSSMPSSQHRAYPTPPLSPLSAARYHPYAMKNPAAAAAAGPSLPPSLLGHGYGAQHSALAPYYSHLALFGPRGLIGSSPPANSTSSLPP